jgi:hypothetical protein
MGYQMERMLGQKKWTGAGARSLLYGPRPRPRPALVVIVAACDRQQAGVVAPRSSACYFVPIGLETVLVRAGP